MSTLLRRKLRLAIPGRDGSVGALWIRPPDARASFVFAHGAGAGMTHPFMESLSLRLAVGGVATLRYQFPYMEKGSRRLDRPAVLAGAVRAAVARVRRLAPELPCIAGGKSMGGRMTSAAQADDPLDGVLGIAFVGFPLHAAGKETTARADHLSRVLIPTLFVQGDRDRLADLHLIESVAGTLGPRAGLHVVRGADHGFHVLKRSGRTDDDALDEVAETIVAWIGKVVGR